MATKAKSRWADDEEDAALEARRKKEKEEKKRARAEKQRRLKEAERARHQQNAQGSEPADGTANDGKAQNEDPLRPAKRRRLTPQPDMDDQFGKPPLQLLRFPAPEWGPCRHVDNFEKLNHIEEGSYGWVSRAKETATGEVVALKKLKMENSSEGFPVTGLREIQTLVDSRHENVVYLREVVMGDSMNE